MEEFDLLGPVPPQTKEGLLSLMWRVIEFCGRDCGSPHCARADRWYGRVLTRSDVLCAMRDGRFEDAAQWATILVNRSDPQDAQTYALWQAARWLASPDDFGVRAAAAADAAVLVADKHWNGRAGDSLHALIVRWLGEATFYTLQS